MPKMITDEFWCGGWMETLGPSGPGPGVWLVQTAAESRSDAWSRFLRLSYGETYAGDRAERRRRIAALRRETGRVVKVKLSQVGPARREGRRR